MSPAVLDSMIDELVDRLTERPDALDTLASKLAERMSATADTADEWLNVPAAAAYLQCGVDRIYALTSAGRLPVHKDGSRSLYRKDELRAFVEAGGAVRP